MRYVYIHGFNSGRQSRSARELGEILKKEIFRPECDYSLPFADCLASLVEQIKASGEPPYTIMGSSLGGFFALQLRFAGIARIVAWNPVIFPAIQLQRFVGRNVRFTDNVEWQFSRETALSYAIAPDPRMWRNFYWQELDMGGDGIPPRDIVLGDRDEILDSELAACYWRGHACLHGIGSGHRVEDYRHVLDILK